MSWWSFFRACEINGIEYEYTHQYDEENRKCLAGDPKLYVPSHTQVPYLSYHGCFELPLFEGLGEGI